MGKIQTEVVSMLQAGMKNGSSSYRTAGVDAAFNKLLKEQNQAADEKAQGAVDSGGKVSETGKEEVKQPVKEKDLKMEETEELQNGEILPSELLLQFQESAIGQFVTVSAEDGTTLEGQMEEILEPPVLLAVDSVQTETVESSGIPEVLMPAENMEDLQKTEIPEALEGIPVLDETGKLVLQSEKEKLQEGGREDMEVLERTEKPQETAGEPEKMQNLQETAVPVKAFADTKEEAKEGTGQEQQFAGVAERPSEYVVQKQEKIVTEPLKTSEPELVNDVGRMVAQRFPGTNGAMTIELEPASLGKLTIHVLYESGKATISIMATNPRTLELLNTRATELASIIEERTGQETVVYTQQPESEQPFDERQGEGQQREREQEQRNHKDQTDQDSFLQQLRLGFV